MVMHVTEGLDVLYEVEVSSPKKQRGKAHRHFRTLKGALRANNGAADKRVVLENLQALESYLYENDLPLLFIEF